MSVKNLALYAVALLVLHLLVSACYLAVFPRPEDTIFGPWIIYWLPLLMVASLAAYRRGR